MDPNDYRNTTYCPKFEYIDKKKADLKKKIIEEDHRTSRNFYELIRDNVDYKKQYFKIYNYKCAYCGTSINILENGLFELDHFKNKADHDDNVNDISNIILACKFCNRQKSSFNVDNISELINPDNNEITKIFYRDKDYYIKIRAPFSENKDINDFYNKLKLNYQFRRLDFLLLNLKGLINKIKNLDFNNKEKIYTILLELKNTLQEKRNLIITKEDIQE